MAERRTSESLGLFRSVLGSVVLSARGPENVLDAVVRFVTGVLKDGTFALHHGDSCGPRSCKGRGIVHDDLIIDCVGVYAREALDQMQVRRFGKSVGDTEPGHIVITEIGHVNDEGVPFPMTSRI